LAQRLSFPPRAADWARRAREREREREGERGGEQGVQCYVTRMYRREKSTYLTRYAIRWHGTYRVTPGATSLDSTRLGSAYPRDSIHVPGSEDTAAVSEFRQLISLAAMPQTAPQLSPSCSSADSSTVPRERNLSALVHAGWRSPSDPARSADGSDKSRVPRRRQRRSSIEERGKGKGMTESRSQCTLR